VLLIAGGSGVVPLRAILRHHRVTASEIPVRLLYSARTRGDLIYRDELANYDTVVTLTNERPQEWSGRTGRIDSNFLTDTAWPPAERPLVYICGPTGFVEAIADALSRWPRSSHPAEVRPDMSAVVARISTRQVHRVAFPSRVEGV
jgi:NAD(P)H-flavin reductase